MNTNKDSLSDPVELDESRDGERRFLFHLSNDHRILRTGREVIAACQLDISVEVWVEELNDLLLSVQKWATGQAARIAACYAVLSGGKVCLFVVPQSRTFDFDLADELATLSRTLFQQYNVGPIELGQIPAHEQDRFIHPGDARLIYGLENGAHEAVDAQP